MVIESHFVKGTSKDAYYGIGPRVDNRILDCSQTIDLTITKFLSPSLFFAYESSTDYILDQQINCFYEALGEFFFFDNIPKVGTICVAKYSYDLKWYRAKVLSLNFPLKKVDLYFIDYGNIERNVPVKDIRKLEGTFSTQYNGYQKAVKHHSQALLFGFIGVKPPAYCFNKDEHFKLKTLAFTPIFSFQVVDVPGIRSNMKDKDLINIPLFLIQNNPFSRTTVKLSDWLIKELNWEECSIDESLEVIIQSLCKIDYNMFNFHIMIPNYLRSHSRSKKECQIQANNSSTENPEQINEEELSNFSGRSVNDPSDNEYENSNNDVLGELNDAKVSDKFEKKNTAETKHDTSQIEEIENDKSEDDNDNFCSIINWKMTPVLVDSYVKGLEWHLPLPEDSVFRALVTDIDDNLGFHINVCSEDIVRSFKSLEKSLQKHFLLCHNSMLRQFVVEETEQGPGTLCLCTHNSTYYRGLIVGERKLDGKFICKLLDFGNEISVEKSEIIPISDQFCRLPPLAIQCTLSGFSNSCENMDILVDQFKQLLLECDYEIWVTLCLMDKRRSFTRVDDKVIISQPIPVEIFSSQTGEDSQLKFFSINSALDEVNQDNIQKIETEELEPMSVSKHELFLSCSKNIDDIESDDSLDVENDGMKDIYITQTILDQAEMPHPYDKKPICEYYRSKGRCFKGSKCADRHVMHSDCSDEEDEDEFKWLESVSYMNRSFERHLKIGSIIGLRVSAIYTSGIFYAYLTHGINGFDNDNLEICQSDDVSDGDSSDDNTGGLDFLTIQDMEASLNDCMTYKYSTFNNDNELHPCTLVAVSVDNKFFRGSIIKEISPNFYQVFLVDYGIYYEVQLEKLFVLPKQFYSKFKQQCFMCKLNGVVVNNESDSKVFAEWFFKKVNKHILHAKIISMDFDGISYVELYDFINDTSSPSINSMAHKELKM